MLLALALAMRVAAQEPAGCTAPATTWATTSLGHDTTVSVPGTLVITGPVAFTGSLTLNVGCDLFITDAGSLTGVGPIEQRQGPAWTASSPSTWPFYGTGAPYGGCGDDVGGLYRCPGSLHAPYGSYIAPAATGSRHGPISRLPR